jgi:hypothetical protein
VAQSDAAKRSGYPAWLSGIRASVFIPVWIVCGLIAAVLISVADHSNQVIYSRLVGHGVVVHATVTRTEPSNHGAVFYSFVADGRTFESGAASNRPNPDASKLKPGDRIPVVYDARDPNVSCACDPRELAASSVWWRRIIGGLFLGSIVALVLTVNIQRRLDRRRGRAHSPARLS